MPDFGTKTWAYHLPKPWASLLFDRNHIPDFIGGEPSVQGAYYSNFQFHGPVGPQCGVSGPLSL